jgi:2-dehydro-3-deoxyphosphogluconate aldolase/(4S)-4-hydroxy-2-oxoglutarate aldolase
VLSREQAFPNRVAGLVQGTEPEAAFRACVAALEGGIGTIQVSMTVPACLEIVRGLAASTGGSLPVGVGAVWDDETVVEAKQAGARFVVTPTYVPEVAQACSREDLLCVMGGLTPTEIQQARRCVELVQVFPVQSLGGPDYVRWLHGPMPDAQLVVSGGVAIDQVEEYLSLGVAAVCLTSALFPPEAIGRGDMALITALARRATAASRVQWA